MSTSLPGSIDWDSVSSHLDAEGYAVTAPILPQALREDLASLYDGP